MKKNGFTLAEVLITLAIIGVVATMTLPALMTNTAEQQAKTGLRKGINTLTEAAQMNQAMEGWDYASLMDADTADYDKYSLFGLLSKRASVDYGRSGKGKVQTHQGDAAATAGSDNFTLFFRDGSCIMYDPESTVAKNTNTVLQADNLPLGFGIIYDTNGSKGPNIISNCQGEALGTDKSDTYDGPAEEVCTPNKRVIKDQFGVKLRGGFAVPNGAAARWAFAN